MGIGDSPDASERVGLLGSLAHALVNPYWLFNLFPITFATLAMGLAAVEHGWNWTVWGLTAACIWFVDNGLHDFDLAADGLAVGVDARVEFVVGGVQILVGVALGVWLAALTTWHFLGVLALATVCGMAYNLEWFDGLLHDRQHVTGVGNFALVVGGLSTYTGYLVLARQHSLGAALFALGPTIVVAGLHWVEEDVKPVKYEVYGVEHTREENPQFERLQRRVVKIVPMHLVAFVAMALGVFVEFVLAGS